MIGISVQQPEVPAERGQLRVGVTVGDADVLTGGDVVRVGGQLEPQIGSERLTNHMDALPAASSRSRAGDARKPRARLARSLRQRPSFAERLESLVVLWDKVLLHHLHRKDRLGESCPKRRSG